MMVDRLKGILTYKEWEISHVMSVRYKAINKKSDTIIIFDAEYKKMNIISIIKNDRIYRAKRYHYNYIDVVMNILQVLLYNNYLWDYNQGQPALESYTTDMVSYYKACKEKNLNTYLPDNIIKMIQKKIQ